MKIRDLFERIIILSGQFLIRKNSIEMDVERFKLLVEQGLAEYSKASPHTEETTVDLRGDRTIKFTNSNSPNIDGVDLGPPDFMSACDPVSMRGTFLLGVPEGNRAHSYNPNLDVKCNAPFKFNRRSKELTVGTPANYALILGYYHRIVKIEEEYEILTLDLVRDSVFVMLIQGMFLQGIGKSRRAFTLNDLPIAMDAAEIASEGDALVDIARDKVENEEHKFYLAYR